MFEFLKHVLNGQNQFASGGLLLMIIGAVGAYLRAIPSRAWSWFVGQTTLSITVKDEDAAFAWVKQWFAEQKFLKRIRRVDLDTTVRNENLALIPAPRRLLPQRRHSRMDAEAQRVAGIPDSGTRSGFADVVCRRDCFVSQEA